MTETDARPGMPPKQPADASAPAAQRSEIKAVRAGAKLYRTTPPENQRRENGARMQYRGVAMEPGRLELFKLTDATTELLEQWRPRLRTLQLSCTNT